ncbi:hypothetical protein [Streptomyces sp. NPDC002564]|uniref:hypothetical protein n=1 Tax=Streptomyces sp. NPDC002564 TaxID=3364649 RepID=UPI003686BFA0
MDESPVGGALARALGPVLRDLSATCAVRAAVTVAKDFVSPGADVVMVCAPDGSGRGVSVAEHCGAAEQVADVADQVQEWVVEELCALLRPAVWPECPAHPGTHPLAAGVERGVAVWSCPRSGRVVAPVGGLGPAAVSP